MLIGREKEIKTLQQAYHSEYSEFVAVYGRRRIGKTFLIREAFNYQFAFQHTGVYKKSLKKQLRNFRDALRMSGMKKAKIPTDWSDAFFQLAQFIKENKEEKKVIFIDEIPWLDTPRSGFLSALEYFWNSFASARKDVLLIICGSATSWIINKVLKNHGGLHNRVTYRIHLQPFTLYECEHIFFYPSPYLEGSTPYSSLKNLANCLGDIPTRYATSLTVKHPCRTKDKP